MPFKSENELEAIRQKLHDTVWPMAHDFDNKNWTHKGGSDVEQTGLVYKGYHPEIGTTWKLDMHIDMSADKYFNHFIKNGELVGWVPHLTFYKILERSSNENASEGWSVTYSETEGFGAVSSRDFVSLNFFKKLPDGSYFLTTIATEHPEAPKNSKCVRGAYLPSCSLLIPLKEDPSRCRVVWVNNCHMKGYMPQSLINMVMSTFTLEFATAAMKKAKEIAAARN